MTNRTNDAQGAGMERLLQQMIPTIGGLLVLVLGAYIVWFSSARVSTNSGDWGTLGDYFGGLMNPIISFATLIVAFAVWKQQREELKATKEALEEQAKTAEQQRREQRFFDLLNVYFRTLESVSSKYIRSITKRGSSSGSMASFFGEQVGSELITLNGKSAISHQRELIESRGEDDDQANWCGVLTKCTSSEAGTEPRKNYQHILEMEWRAVQSESDIGHFLRTVTMILSEAELLLGTDHKRYADIFIAQLSDDELTLLGYYMWLDQSGQELLLVAKKYCLLRNLKRRLEEFRACLPPEVFSMHLIDKSNQDATLC